MLSRSRMAAKCEDRFIGRATSTEKEAKFAREKLFCEGDSSVLSTLWVHFMVRIGLEGKKMQKMSSSSSSQELKLFVGAGGVLRPPDTLEISSGGPVGLETRRGI